MPPSPALPLWPGVPPHDRAPADALVSRIGGAVLGGPSPPALTPWLLQLSSQPRPLLVVMPGGGYVRLSTVDEGETVCEWLNSIGYHAAVLVYRVLRLHPAPLLDARRAIQLVRQHAHEWGVSSVGVIGFSAGGHLAGHVALSWDAALARRLDSQMREEGDRPASKLARPDAALLAYPVVSAHNTSVVRTGGGSWRCSSFACIGPKAAGRRATLSGRPSERPLRHHGSIATLLGWGADASPLGNESDVSLEDIAHAAASPPPPFFIWHTEDDSVVPSENSEVLVRALRARSFPVEFHLFQGKHLKHGLGMAFKLRHRRDVETGRWPKLAEGWLRRVLP